MTIEEFLTLSPEERAKYEVERIGCEGVKMVSLEGHSMGAFHAICVVCKTCHDCDDGE